MPEKYVGVIGIDHLKQPEGTEFCFATCVAAFVGSEVEIDQVQMSLENAYVSDEDGTTPPPEERQEVPILGSMDYVTIDVIQGPEQDTPDAVNIFERITESLGQEKPVLLLYKKTTEPDDDSLHWVLIKGYVENDSPTESKTFEVVDSLADDIIQVPDTEIIDMIDRSIQSRGVFAYNLELGNE